MVGHAKIRLDEWIVKFFHTMYANTKYKVRVNNLYTTSLRRKLVSTGSVALF